MVRLFNTHYIRNTQELDGIWQFQAEGSDNEYGLPVPGCWEQHPELLNYRGRGSYTKKVYIKQDGNVRMEFKGVSHTADVYFDGVKTVHHYNAFTPFSAVIKDVKAGEHVIRVDVDNSFGEYSALHIPNDYYTYGGITRPVVLESIADAYIKYVHFTPKMTDGIWSAKIEAVICNLSDSTVNAEIRSSLADIEMCGTAEIGAGSEATIVFEKEFSNVKAWSNAEPNLYMLQTVLYANGQAVDDLIERVGFRTVNIDGAKIMVNGEEIYLKGFNRHEDYAVDGCAVSVQHMVQDMDLMLDMNANAVRTCHYPNDERFLDLCDERGIFVWEENHARGLYLEDMQNPNFERQCEDCIIEMIENHYNHPSIIIWGILNECASETEEGREMYQKQYNRIRNMDISRPLTSATCRHFTDICLDLLDIVSVNLYSGWYDEFNAEERKDKILEWIKNSGGDNKPVIISEFGAAAIYGYRDRSRCKWSEERQADIIRDNLDVYMKDNNITGVIVWQFADCRVTEEKWFTSRARCHNNKGIVDEYRRPKIAYDTIKEMFENQG